MVAKHLSLRQVNWLHSSVFLDSDPALFIKYDSRMTSMKLLTKLGRKSSENRNPQKLQTHKACVCLYGSLKNVLCLGGHMYMWRAQRSQFFPLDLKWVLGLELRLTDLRGKHLYPLSQHGGP